MGYRILIVWLFLLQSFAGNSQVKSNVGTFDEGMRPEFSENISSEEKAKQITSMMKKELKLQNDTARLVYRVNVKYEKEYDEQLANSPNMTAYDKAILRKIRQEQSEELQKLLTKDQWNQFKRKQEERMK